MRLVQIGDKFVIVRGIFFKEYMDMTDDWYSDTRSDCYWWPVDLRRTSLLACITAPTAEYALDRLAEYRATKLKNKTKTIKWWV